VRSARSLNCCDRELSFPFPPTIEKGRPELIDQIALTCHPPKAAAISFATEKPATGARLNAKEQIERTALVFERGGWEVPRLVEALRRADDLYADAVSQIRMPQWSKGRVALVGDSAFAPSFLSGQGTSLAIVGAYVLAGELASHEDPADAFATHERIARPFVETNQDLPFREGGTSIILRT
jgi:2-polyprenyl-6-methoxyphenol hydroxylase-like FAD-dependent oxidoreductase